jgi:hypothetical protein
MFAIKAPVVKVVAAAQNQKSEKKAMCVFASTRSTLDFEFCFFLLFYRERERERVFYNRNWERKALPSVACTKRKKKKRQRKCARSFSSGKRALSDPHRVHTRALPLAS